ncbi:MAG TPA: BON domain-containing protein [Cellvibrionaceae bacterium]
MRLFNRHNFLAPVLILGLLGSANPALADAAGDLVNARQETQIWTTYALSPYLRANDLHVTVNNGKATLTGTVAEDVNKDLAKQIALGVSGVKEVDNQIKVDADFHPKKPVNDYGQAIDDASITSAIKSKLLWSKSTDGRSIDVETKNGRVKLTGNASTKQMRDSAGRLASGTRGVTSVNNQIAVDSATPSTGDKAKSEAKEIKQDISDAWISTKVASTFMYSSNVAGSDIDVTTDKGVVTLKGKVDSGAERALAIELAENVRGVKTVVAKDLTF